MTNTAEQRNERKTKVAEVRTNRYLLLIPYPLSPARKSGVIIYTLSSNAENLGKVEQT
jgi:hypothetical protein